MWKGDKMQYLHRKYGKYPRMYKYTYILYRKTIEWLFCFIKKIQAGQFISGSGLEAVF